MTAYSLAGSSELRAAQLALSAGLTALRRSLLHEMRNLDVRGDGSTWRGDGSVADGGARRTRNKPHTDVPGRPIGPGTNTKQVPGGRLGTSNRPTMPAQPGVGQSPAESGETTREDPHGSGVLVVDVFRIPDLRKRVLFGRWLCFLII